MSDQNYKQAQNDVTLSPGIVEDEPSNPPVTSPFIDDDMEEAGDILDLNEPAGDDDDDDDTSTELEQDVAKKSSYTMTNIQVFKDPKYNCTAPPKLPDADTMVAIANHTSNEINGSTKLKAFIESWAEKEALRAKDSQSTKRTPSDAWMEQFEAAMEHVILGGLTTKTLENPDSAWHQYLEHEGKRIRAHKPKYTVPEEGLVDGATAQAVLDNRLGLGGHITVALPHSGFWITLKPVTPLEFLGLDEQLSSIKNEFGRLSIGLIFNNNRVFVVKHMVEFLLERVYDCSIEGWQNLDLAKHIKVTDLLILAAGGGYTLYPHGFDYAAPCTADNDCDHTHKAVLKIPNCIWYDHPAFDKFQTELLANRSKKHPLKDIIKYQETFEERENSFKTEEGITIYFKIPTVKEHVDSGSRWFADVEAMVDEVIVSSSDKDSKHRRMQRRINQTVLRQQAHFFKRISFEEGIYMEGEEDLANALNSLSNRPGITEAIMEHIGTYIDANIHALVAIPRYACEKCHETQPQEEEKHPFLIPLDTINLFFTLGNQRLRIGSPSMLNQNS